MSSTSRGTGARSRSSISSYRGSRGRWISRLTRGTSLAAADITDLVLSAAPGGLEVLLLDRANRGIHRTDARLTPSSGESFVALPADARSPEELARAADGRLAVADPVARRVFVRATDGAWKSLDRLGDIAFLRPSGVEFDESGRLVVSDAARDAVVVEGPGGTARVVGERGILDEQFFDPQSILPSPKGLIVIDRGNHRFERFGPGFTWNLTGSLGRYYDEKRKGSPGAAPASTPAAPGPSSPKGGGR